ncbi:YncE family protein [Sphingomonas sp. Y38-1Y]|uniref:YncE family protein n=1 Tax=Sphingomonas sp. Y38-1Y TaxID=3078265 RepID=UPI0028F0AC69|nr:beta-propeller fold lactonase family protein [Sphingomonas sp. Y38-1Y]
MTLALATAAAADTLVVGNKEADSVEIIDLSTGRARARVPTGPRPHEVAVSPDGRIAAVAAYGGSAIDLIELASGRLIERVELFPNRAPHGIAWIDDDRLVAAAEGSGSLAIVRVSADGDGPRVRSVPLGTRGAHMVVVAADRATAYVVNRGSASVTRVDLRRSTKLDDTPVGREPEGVALSPDGSRLWIADRATAEVLVFDTRTMRPMGTVPVGPAPIRVAVSPDGDHAVVANAGNGTLTVIDTRLRRTVRTLTVGDVDSRIGAILFAPDGKRLYVAETGHDHVAEVDFSSGQVLRRLKAGSGADGLALTN